MNKFLIIVGFLITHTLQAQQLSVYFDYGKSTLSDKEKHRIDSLIRTFETELIYDIKLVGHTDSIGALGGNKQLSKQRADAVYAYFPKKINCHFSSIIGKAYTAPIQSNSTDEGRAQNRRCDIYITVSKVKSEKWLMPTQSFNIKNSDSSILYTKNGCKVYVAPGTFKLKDGDSINIQVTEYNTPAEFIAGGLPMSFSKNGKPYMYESEQMMKIEAFVNSTPIPVMKLLGLQCPNVDTSNNVKFYEFSGKSSTHANVTKELEEGRVDVVTKLVVVDPVILPATNSTNTDAGTKSKVKEEKSYDFDYSGGTKPSKNSVEKSAKDAAKEKVSEKNHRDVFKLKKDTSSRFKIEPDTSFILEPDTSRMYSSGGYLGGGGGSGGDPYSYCSIQGTCFPYLDVCDSNSTRKQIAFGQQYANKQFFKSELMDLNDYFSRYKDLSYDGMELKCEKAQDKLFVIHTTFKRRIGNKTSFVFTSFENNPEYEPLKKIKWIIYRPIENGQIQLLMKSDISDFRIFRGGYSLKNPKGTYYIEIKTDTAFYRFSVKATKRSKSEKAYDVYADLFNTRVVKLNDSIERYIEDNKIEELYCLYKLSRILSKGRKIYNCHYHKYEPACFIFYFFTSNYYLKNLDECHSNRECFYDVREFLSWLKFYNANMVLLQEELGALKQDLKRVIKCECTGDTPCKWEYHGGSNTGDNIISVGLGEYNFDREIALDDQIRIIDAIYLNEQGDTILKCTKQQPLNYTPPIACNHTTFTIIPGFNGLLKQNDPTVLQLLPGKKNMLYFENYGRKYKLYLDLTNRTSYKGNIFILKEITEEASTLDGLIKQLEIME